MITLKKEEYDFIVQNMPNTFECVKNVKEDNSVVTFDVDDFTDFLVTMNFDIVDNGMDNQDTVNKLGIQMYRIYDNILAQK
ncbi:MAG: hypothetical protein SOU50_10395 [Oscillospiraceae bacterium]|nr:hypothetical protein [Oscillospiraceae bacterium]MDY2848608.1 hypothetical protein [Oscillospiraceae bacterium]